ncbi:MAG: hypothetical protein ACYCVZ_05185 [Streptosporangiaceae bacterium]
METAEFVAQLPGTVTGARTNQNGSVVVTKPSHFYPDTNVGTLLLVASRLLLAGLAAAMGVVSWHAQFAYVLSVKHQPLAAGLEAVGLDAGAVIFSVLGIALARLGRRALIERALVVLCAGGSCAMNLLSANLGSPRSVAVYVMPPLLFAAGSDRLIAVIRRSALGPAEDSDDQRSAFRLAGRAGLYVLRLVAAPPSTLLGARRALLTATPLPQKALPAPEAPLALPGPQKPVQRRPRKPKPPTKTEALLALVVERHGPLTEIPLEKVGQIATDAAAVTGLHPGSARGALRRAVVAARAGNAAPESAGGGEES